MAIDRTTAADTGSALIGLYSNLEARLIELVAERLRSAVADPDSVQWAERHLRQTTELRTAAERMYRALGRPAVEEAATAILEAQAVGQRAALRELGARAKTPGLVQAISDAAAALNSGRDLPRAGAIDQIARSLTGKLGALELPVTRWVSDVFQDVIFAGAVPGQLAGIDTRRQAAARAWNQLLNQGVTGMVDRGGRKWNLATYVEMSTRTATSQASIEAHNSQLQALGLSLVIVSDVPGECIICRPWEGKILTTSGAGGAQTLRVQRADNDDYVTVKVAGSVTEARAAGLFHPNCRHSIGAYFPGLTRIPTRTEDPKLDEARRELRGLERDTRKWKMREAGALTPEDRARARAKVREAQAKIEKLIAERGGVERGLPRRRDREQIDLGNVRRKPPTTGPSSKPTTPKPKPKPTPPAPKPKPVKPAPPPPAPKPAKTTKPKPAKVTPPAAPPTGMPKPTTPRLPKPWERFDPPPNSKYFDPSKHPLTPLKPPKDARGVYEWSPAPQVDYGKGRHMPSVADVVAGRAHIEDLIKLKNSTGRRLVPQGPFENEVRAALELFGDLAPRSLLELREVSGINIQRWQVYGGNANAFYVTYEHPAPGLVPMPFRSLTMSPAWYDPTRRNNLLDLKHWSYQSGWSSWSAYPASGGTMLHELGHHMQTMMYPGRFPNADPSNPLSAYSPLDQRIIDVIVSELGLRAPSGGTRGLSAAGMTRLIESGTNQARVADLVSTYGSRSFEEMFAEIFQEYATLGINARPHIQRIGEAIVRLAETGQL